MQKVILGRAPPSPHNIPCEMEPSSPTAPVASPRPLLPSPLPTEAVAVYAAPCMSPAGQEPAEPCVGATVCTPPPPEPEAALGTCGARASPHLPDVCVRVFASPPRVQTLCRRCTRLPPSRQICVRPPRRMPAPPAAPRPCPMTRLSWKRLWLRRQRARHRQKPPLATPAWQGMIWRQTLQTRRRPLARAHRPRPSSPLTSC